MDLGIRAEPSARPTDGEKEFTCGVCGKDEIDGMDSDADDKLKKVLKWAG